MAGFNIRFKLFAEFSSRKKWHHYVRDDKIGIFLTYNFQSRLSVCTFYNRKKYIDKSDFNDESLLVNELDKQFMEQVVEYIEEKMMNEDFSIDTLAIEMAMSRSVFFKKIKSLTGQNPQEFIRDIKMKRAATLLREHKYSIGEIAYLTGYPNAKYFSTAFKKYYGCTPSSS